MPLTKQRLGIVVPTLNSSATLMWTLCALRNQQDITVDILVADSGSEDGTLDICKRWNVNTIFVPPGNMYRAINTGLRQMDTEWVTYLNSDDIVYPRSYVRLVSHGEQQEAALAYGDSDFIDIEGRFLFSLRAPSPRRLGHCCSTANSASRNRRRSTGEAHSGSWPASTNASDISPTMIFSPA